MAPRPKPKPPFVGELDRDGRLDLPGGRAAHPIGFGAWIVAVAESPPDGLTAAEEAAWRELTIAAAVQAFAPLSTADVAVLLGQGREYVRMRYHTGLTKLRAALEAQGYDGRDLDLGPDMADPVVSVFGRSSNTIRNARASRSRVEDHNK